MSVQSEATFLKFGDFIVRDHGDRRPGAEPVYRQEGIKKESRKE
jgi:hypothetical protein